MKIVRAYPPNYAELRAIFPISGRPVFFSYGSTIFDPTGAGLTPSLMAHEEVHGERQRAQGVEGWWRRYIDDPAQRFVEETLAHRAELAFILRHGGGRHERRRAVAQLAARLASPLYGGMVSARQARQMLAGAMITKIALWAVSDPPMAALAIVSLVFIFSIGWMIATR